MMTIPATYAHIAPMVARLDPERRAQLLAMTGGVGILYDNIRLSSMTWCGVDGDGPVTLGGVVPATGGDGYLWQIITPAIALHKRAYLLQGRAVISRALLAYVRLVTVIEADYTAALRHVRRLGWQVGSAIDMGGTMACRCWRMR